MGAERASGDGGEGDDPGKGGDGASAAEVADEASGGVEKNKKRRDGGGGSHGGPAAEEEEWCQENAASGAGEAGEEYDAGSGAKGNREGGRGNDVGLTASLEKPPRGKKEDDSDEWIENRGGEMEVAAEEGGGDGEKGEWPEERPREVPCAPELECPDRCDHDVEDQRGRLDLGGGESGEGEDGDVSRSSGVSNRGVEKGDDRDRQGHQSELEVVHAGGAACFIRL